MDDDSTESIPVHESIPVYGAQDSSRRHVLAWAVSDKLEGSGFRVGSILSLY